MKPRERRTGGARGAPNAYPPIPEKTVGSSAGTYLSVAWPRSYPSFLHPRPVCPLCGSRQTSYLAYGLFDSWNPHPSWQIPAGCMACEYDWFCESCELVWDSTGAEAPMWARTTPGLSSWCGIRARCAEYSASRRRIGSGGGNSTRCELPFLPCPASSSAS